MITFGQETVPTTSESFPTWIANEKIRGGFLFASGVKYVNDTKYAGVIRSNGLNTVIATGDFHVRSSFNGTLQQYRRWAQAAKREKLHLFISYSWQPSKSYSYRPVVYSDGTIGPAPCARDSQYWQNYLIYLGKVIAELSLEPNSQVDGIFLDCELAYSEDAKKSYGRQTCFCDNCFSNFLFTKGYSGEQLPSVEYRQRESWLREKELLDEYFLFLEKDVEELARKYEQELHRINPSFLIGMYPTIPNDWVLKAIARGFGTERFPVIHFATDSYYIGGHTSIPDKPVELYRKSGINNLYVAGFTLRSYRSDELEINLYESAKKCSGYWLFVMPMLWQPPSEGFELAGGTQQEYWQAIKKANDNIDMFISKKSP